MKEKGGGGEADGREKSTLMRPDVGEEGGCGGFQRNTHTTSSTTAIPSTPAATPAASFTVWSDLACRHNY